MWWQQPLRFHPRYVWLLWAIAVLVLASCPLALSDPAIWFYVLDPELLAMFVVIGAQYAGIELGLARLRVRAAGRRVCAALREDGAIGRPADDA